MIRKKQRKIQMVYDTYVGTNTPAKLKSQRFKSISSAAYTLEIERTTINNICTGKQKRAKYNGAWVTFEYIDE